MTEFDKVIHPGGVGKVTASVDTAHFKGPVTKSVTVTTNDPAMPRITLSIQADVKVAVDVQPSEMASFTGRVGELKPVELTVTATDGQPFDILSAAVSPDQKVTVAFAPAPGQKSSKKPGTLAAGATSYVMTVQPSPDFKVGQPNSGSIAVKTSHPKAADLPLRYFANVTGNIQISPERTLISVPAEMPPEGVTQHVIIRPAAGATGPKLVVKNPVSSDPRITTTLSPSGEGFDLAVTYKGTGPAASIPGSVTLETNDPLQPTLTIPVGVRPSMASALPGTAIQPAAAAAPGHEGHAH